MVLCVVLSLYSFKFINTYVKYVKTYPPNTYIYIYQVAVRTGDLMLRSVSWRHHHRGCVDILRLPDSPE